MSVCMVSGNTVNKEPLWVLSLSLLPMEATARPVAVLFGNRPSPLLTAQSSGEWGQPWRGNRGWLAIGYSLPASQCTQATEVANSTGLGSHRDHP